MRPNPGETVILRGVATPRQDAFVVIDDLANALYKLQCDNGADDCKWKSTRVLENHEQFGSSKKISFTTELYFIPKTYTNCYPIQKA